MSVTQSGRGFLRVLKGNPKSTAELIPADTVVNTLLSVVWYQYSNKSSVDSALSVYNLTSNASRRLTWQSLGEYHTSPCYRMCYYQLETFSAIPSAKEACYSTIVEFGVAKKPAIK